MSGLWGRKAELIIGPLEEWRMNKLSEGPSLQSAIRIVSDGSTNTLKLSFSIRLHDGYIAPASTITVHNLTKEVREVLQKPLTGIILKAGYESDSALAEIFSGSLASAVSHREGPDIVTTILAIPNFKDVNMSYCAASFDQGTPLREVVLQIAGMLEICSDGIDETLVELPKVVIGDRGLSVSGKTMDVLNDLARNFGFTWWVDGGMFRTKIDGTMTGNVAALISYKNNMLLRAEPLLASVWQVTNGISFRCMLHPRVRCGEVVQIESNINPSLNGPWRIQGLSHTGDTKGGPWYTDGESLLTSNYSGQ